MLDSELQSRVVPCQTSWHLGRAPVPGFWHGLKRWCAGKIGSATPVRRTSACPSSVMCCCRAWSHPLTAPVPTCSGRRAVPTSWHGCQVGATNLAQVSFSLARDNGGGLTPTQPNNRLAGSSLTSDVRLPRISGGYTSWPVGRDRDRASDASQPAGGGRAPGTPGRTGVRPDRFRRSRDDPSPAADQAVR